VVGRERLPDLHPAVKIYERGHVVRPKRVHEPDGRFLRQSQTLLHARAGIHDEGDRQRNARLLKEGDDLRPVVFKNDEFVLGEVGDEPSLAVGDGHVDFDEIDDGAKRNGGLRVNGLAEKPAGETREQNGDDCTRHGRP
jgi:hypothetical protein